MCGSGDLNPDLVPYRTMGEWTFSSDAEYRSPFADVAVDAVFTGPSGETFRMPAFYDGDGIWKVRFNPGEVGKWTYRL